MSVARRVQLARRAWILGHVTFKESLLLAHLAQLYGRAGIS